MKPLMLAAFTLLTSSVVFADTFQPVAEVRLVTDELHGVSVEDPYRYFEEKGNPEVDAWAREQAAFTKSYFEQQSKVDEIFNRMKELDAAGVDQVSKVSIMGSGTRYFVMRRIGEQLSNLYWQHPGEASKLLIEPTELVESETARIDYYSVSPNEAYLACGISYGGSENATLFIIDTKTGQQVDQPIERARWQGAFWLPDSSGFFYNQLQYVGPDGDPQQAFQKSKVFLHKIGKVKDTLILGHGVNPTVPVEPERLPFIYTYPDSDWAIALISTGVSPDFDIYIAPAMEVDGSTEWTPVCKMADEVGSMRGGEIAIHGDSIYLLTRKEAPNGKIIRVNLSNPDISKAEEVYSAGRGVITYLYWAKDAMYAKVLEGGPSSFVRLPFDDLSQPTPVVLPELGRVQPLNFRQAGSRFDGVYFFFGNWMMSPQLYYYNPETRTAKNTHIVPENKPAICDELVQKVVYVKSHDGTEVPLTIVHRKDLELNGDAPTLLIGYGAYGLTIEPSLWDTTVPFYEQGGVFAVAHIRGGGAFGKDWHMAGHKTTKPNTWKDFIACAEYLIDEGYTDSEHLTGSGRSAGGITIGRAITERPDLFGKAIIGVGVSDAVRAETTPNGVPNIPEFGTVKNKDEFHALLEMSPYHHVKDGVDYPAVLIVHGANDTRVELWQSLKMGARLQAATTSDEPVLLRIDYDSGHGSNAKADKRYKRYADEYAFILE